MTLENLVFAAYGLAAGLLGTALVWLLAWWKQRGLRAEVKQLRNHLHTQMEISQEGSTSRNKELESLRKQSENLRVTIKALEQKPGRSEVRQLHIYDHAVRQLLSSTPGFSIAWEAALKAAEEHHQEVDKGLFAFARRVISPAKRVSAGSVPEDSEE